MDEFKTTFLNSGEGGIEHMFAIVETSLPFRDLLAKTRHDAKGAGVECPGFLVFDKQAAAKQAVLFVEVSDMLCDVKGMTQRYPSAATTRRFHYAIDQASNHMGGLSIGENDWWETWDAVKSGKRGEVWLHNI